MSDSLPIAEFVVGAMVGVICGIIAGLSKPRFMLGLSCSFAVLCAGVAALIAFELYFTGVFMVGIVVAGLEALLASSLVYACAFAISRSYRSRTHAVRSGNAP